MQRSEKNCNTSKKASVSKNLSDFTSE